MPQLLSPKQVATSIGVSESSLKRWCDQGVILTERTPGGHRKIRLSEVVRFLRDGQRPMPHPEQIGLPAGIGRTRKSIEAARELLFCALQRGDNELARCAILDAYLTGAAVAAICERLVAPVMHRVGQSWECGELDVYEEHRAAEVVYRALYELRGLLPPPVIDAPRAIGGTPSGDPYRIASLMVELVLASAGWRAESLGVSLPTESLIEAARRHAPRLFWVSVTHVEDAVALEEGLRRFVAVLPAETRIVLGGQGLEWIAFPSSPQVIDCANLADLADWAGANAESGVTPTPASRVYSSGSG